MDSAVPLAEFVRRTRAAVLPFDAQKELFTDEQSPGGQRVAPSRTLSIEELPVALAVLKYGTSQLEPIAYNALRMSVGTVVLLALACALAPMPPRRDIRQLMLLGVLGHGVYQGFFINGLALTRAGTAALVVDQRLIEERLEGLVGERVYLGYLMRGAETVEKVQNRYAPGQRRGRGNGCPAGCLNSRAIFVNVHDRLSPVGSKCALNAGGLRRA